MSSHVHAHPYVRYISFKICSFPDTQKEFNTKKKSTANDMQEKQRTKEEGAEPLKKEFWIAVLYT